MRLTRALLLLAIATSACRSEDDDTGGTPDASLGTDGQVAVTIKSINMAASAPTPKQAVFFDNVVVVARVTSSSQGHVWVQDPGGGAGAGFHIFCSFTSTNDPCVHKGDFIDGLQAGDVISVSGLFTVFNLNSHPDDWELIRPVITKKGSTMTPVAVTIPASMVAKGAVTSAEFKKQYNNNFVKITDEVAIQKYQAPEYQGDCMPVGLDGGLPAGKYYDNGFEGKAGTETVMIGFGLFDTLDRCLPDCGFCTPDHLVSETDVFSSVQGIAYADRRSNVDFVEIRPRVDADLPKK